MRSPATASRLASFGTTIFTEMTRLANQHGAVNLAQGFPDFAGPGFAKEAAIAAIRADHNQYARMQGAVDVSLPGHPGWLAEEIRNRGDRRHFVRAMVDARGNVRSAGLQASHALGSLAAANALLAVPPQASWAVGRPVEVLRWEL